MDKGLVEWVKLNPMKATSVVIALVGLLLVALKIVSPEQYTQILNALKGF